MIQMIMKVQNCIEKLANIANEAFENFDKPDLEQKYDAMREKAEKVGRRHKNVVADAQMLGDLEKEIKAIVPDLDNKYPDVFQMINNVQEYAAQMERDAIEPAILKPAVDNSLKPSV